jgi:ribulose-phosphate 3-epimerase
MGVQEPQPGSIVIAPSILSADFARLGEEVRAVLSAGADWIHFDVMDNHYVPNLTIGPMVCSAIKPHVGHALIDVHLMVEPVDALVPQFAKAGAGLISFHPEASRHVDRTLQLIRDQNCLAGLVFNPATPLDWLDHVLDKLDLVLLMSVKPRIRRAGLHPLHAGEAAPHPRAARPLPGRDRTAHPSGGRRRREDR